MSSAANSQGGGGSSVLVVDDDPGVHRLLSEMLKSSNYEVSSAKTGQEALEVAAQNEFDIILLDVGLPDISGIEALRRLRADSNSTGVVMISTDDATKVVVDAMRLGALDYLVKPLRPDKVLATVALAARTGRLERENRRLMRQLEAANAGQGLIGCSTAARRLAEVVRRVAEGDTTVLIEGKPGTGKSLVAELVHRSGRRSTGPLITVVCEETSVEALEHAFEQARRGTLVLEDVDAMPANTQARLVRYLKERASLASIEDARVIAITNAKLPELVSRSKFREDLYYRLNMFPITVPSLQERRDDISLLATHFLREAAEVTGVAQSGFTASAMVLLESNAWPGNVAQLHNAVMRAHSLAGGSPIDPVHLVGASSGVETEGESAAAAQPGRQSGSGEDEIREEDILPLDAEEKRLLARALKATRGNVRRAAQLLRIGRATLYRKIQVYNLRLH